MKNKSGNSLTIILIVLAAVIVIGACIGGYLYFNSNKPASNNYSGQSPQNYQNGSGRPIQLNQSQIDDVTSFFNTNPSATDIQTYCSTNRINCAYYCRTINPSTAYCKTMMNFTRGNFSRRSQSAPPTVG